MLSTADPMDLLLPDATDLTLDALGGRLDAVRTLSPLEPFGNDVTDFVAGLAHLLSRSPETRAYPEVQALAFWMRRAEVTRMGNAYRELERDYSILVPQGLVFHVPPSNVDTIFLYSWLLSVLTGNANAVRISSSASPVVEGLIGVIRRHLAEPENAAVRERTLMLRYGYDTEVTARLSDACDVRVIWGGDQTVGTIRAIPIGSHTDELVFGDRFSLSALDARAVLILDDPALLGLAENVYNDAYWFDQMGCSSPRVLVWAGTEGDVRAASTALAGALQRTIKAKHYAVETGQAISKRTFAFQAVLDHDVTSVSAPSNELSLVDVATIASLPHDHCGGGLFFQVRVDAMRDLVPVLTRRDQTLSTFGFEQDERVALARALAGRGVDRIVPIGQALTFGRYWDGYDLLERFSRRVHILPATQTLQQIGAPPLPLNATA